MGIAISLRDYLDNEGVDYELVEHPYSVTSMRTAFEAHVSGDDIAKAVVLHDEQGYVLAVVPATHKVQLGKLSRQYKRGFALAEEKELHHLFDDCSIGAIPPIGKAYGIEVIMDDHLSDHSDIYFEAGDHIDLVHVSGKDFQDLLGNAKHGVFSRHL